MNTQNENVTKQDLKQDLLEAKIDALTTMTRAAIVLLIITLIVNGGVASVINGIMSTLTQEVLNRGYKYYDWNISSGDAGNTTDKAQEGTTQEAGSTTAGSDTPLVIATDSMSEKFSPFFGNSVPELI